MDLCPRMKDTGYDIDLNIIEYKVLFDAISVIFPPVLSYDFQIVITYTRYLDVYKFTRNKITEHEGGAIYPLLTKKLKYSLGGNVFTWAKDSYISVDYM